LAKNLAGKKYRYLLINFLVGQKSRAVGKQSGFGWPAILAEQAFGQAKVIRWAVTNSDVPVRPFAPVLTTTSWARSAILR
jgi:hypothetical protein